MRLKTFGRPTVVDDEGDEVALQPLPLAVLAYLAVGGPRDRQHLADLFWHNSKNALNSLSTTLNRIRADVPNAIWVRGNTVVVTNLRCDVDDLREAVAEGDFASITPLYDASFLGSLPLRRQSVEFEEWVLETRVTLASTVELALLQHGLDLSEAGEVRAAAEVAETAREVAIRDGFPSPDHFESYHRILTTAGRPSAKAVRSMAEEFGVALPLVEQPAVGSDKDSAPAPQPTAAANELFGRDDDLDVVASSVVSQRLTTLIGLGGSGKTRLAEELFAGTELDAAFADRHWIDLRDVDDPALVAPTIASSLGQRFVDVAALADQLADDEPVLVVLDNFEQVIDAAHIVDELAGANDALRILVTSRVPLDVGVEALVPLSGLATGDDDQRSPAEQLFAASARRAGAPDDRLDGKHRAAIRDVCRRVAGNPLALEIAGGWVQILSAADIAEALTAGTDLLGSPMHGEDKSVDAVLSQAWSMLSDADQHTLMLLSAFPAGVPTKEALKIPELPVASIGRLVKCSLASMHVEGRINLHPLVARHAQSELVARKEQHRDFQAVLTRWCTNFSDAIQSEATPSAPVYSLDYGPELANFASAWQWEATHQRWGLHQATLAPLREFYARSGRVRKGRTLMARARCTPGRPGGTGAAQGRDARSRRTVPHGRRRDDPSPIPPRRGDVAEQPARAPRLRPAAAHHGNVASGDRTDRRGLELLRGWHRPAPDPDEEAAPSGVAMRETRTRRRPCPTRMLAAGRRRAPTSSPRPSQPT